MAEELSEFAKDAASEALRASLKLNRGGDILFSISTDNVKVARDVCITVGTLGALYAGYLLLKPLVEAAVNKGLGGTREDQKIRDIKPGSLLVLLHCLTDERLLEVLEDFESGKIKECLQKEFMVVGIEVGELNVEIINIEEVNETKAAIKENTWRPVVNMATGFVETPEVMVSDSLIRVNEFDRVKRPVCLLRPSTADPAESWSASGFYVNVKLKDQSHESVDCIMTNYHVYEEKQKYNQTIVAVFHHEGSSQKQTVEIPLVPCKLLASSEGKDLDYVLIRLNESMRRALADVEPIMADVSKLPSVKKGNTVYIIQHPGGRKKHFSQSTIRRVNPPFIEYYADTLKGSSGSPVFVAINSSFLLVALHSAGVDGYTNSWNKGVLFSEIFNHLHTGRFTKPALPTPGDPAIPSTMENRTDVTKPALPTPGDPAQEDSQRAKTWLLN